MARALQRADEADIGGEIVHAAGLGDRQAKRLEAIILQHDLRHLVGHLVQQRVARLLREATFGHLLVEGDLDVDLIVRAVDAGRIINEVGVDAPAPERVGDAPRLRHAQIGALADHLGAHILGIHAQAIIGRVAHIGITLRGGLDVGADAAEPEQVSLRPQQRGDERRGLHGLLVRADERLHFRAERDALEAAREDAAAFGDERLVIIIPA